MQMTMLLEASDNLAEFYKSSQCYFIPCCQAGFITFNDFLMTSLNCATVLGSGRIIHGAVPKRLTAQ